MAIVTLYFQPFPATGADGMIIQESADGSTGWALIETVGAGDVGTYPDYITSYTTSEATSEDAWFRFAWTISGVPQGYSDPVQVGALPPMWTAPDIVQSMTIYPAIKTASDLYLQQLIDLAYFMLQDECGPYDETNPGFIARAPLAMKMMVEYLFVTTDPAVAAAVTGVIEEQIGSYRYKLSDRAGEIARLIEVPMHIGRLLCPFSLATEDGVEIITTQVFTQTPFYDGDSEQDKEYVYVDGVADLLAATAVRVWAPS